MKKVYNIAKRLDYLRRKNSLTWQSFAEKAGVSQSAITYYKRGRTPDISALQKISEAFAVSIDYLATGAGAEEIEKESPVERKPIYEFSIRLADLMDKQGLSPTEISRKTGASRQLVSNWLRARNFPGSPYAARLAGLLGVTKDYLITGKTFERHETIYPPELGIRNQDLGNKNTNISARSGKCPADKLEKMFHDLTIDQELCNDLINYYEYLLNKKTEQKKSGESGSSKGA